MVPERQRICASRQQALGRQKWVFAIFNVDLALHSWIAAVNPESKLG
jgi:hypothetical protein